MLEEGEREAEIVREVLVVGQERTLGVGRDHEEAVGCEMFEGGLVAADGLEEAVPEADRWIRRAGTIHGDVLTSGKSGMEQSGGEGSAVRAGDRHQTPAGDEWAGLAQVGMSREGGDGRPEEPRREHTAQVTGP
ncbi:MAG: hypothetical protein SFZ23_15930 [Planctomycetota bacterium]|nr:hypothetical protein [Planctomycetota bacterium]